MSLQGAMVILGAVLFTLLVYKSVDWSSAAGGSLGLWDWQPGRVGRYVVDRVPDAIRRLCVNKDKLSARELKQLELAEVACENARGVHGFKYERLMKRAAEHCVAAAAGHWDLQYYVRLVLDLDLDSIPAGSLKTTQAAKTQTW
jgi:hypothetical protein